MKQSVMVFGCGAWGTTLAQLVAGKGHPVSLVCHDKKIADEINGNHTNTTYLPAKPILSEKIKAVLESEALALFPKAAFIFVVVASPFYRKTLQQIHALLCSDQVIISATKGMEEGSNHSILEIAKHELKKKTLKNQFVLLSGPNLAGEIFAGKPAATVIAGKNKQTTKSVQALISSPFFRAYVSDDLLGVEYGGILKNAIAIGAGMVDAMELGANAKAGFMVRGIAEMKRFALAQGGKEETLSGLSGFGDLITTCLGPQSRNYSVGYRIGKGEKIGDIVGSMVAVAEGVKTCKVIHELARQQGIEMPIIDAVYRVLYKNLSLTKAIDLLMTRELKQED